MSFLQFSLTTSRNVDLTNKKGDDILIGLQNALASSAAGTGPLQGWSLVQGSAALSAGSLSRACAGVTLSSAGTTLTTTINGTASAVSVGADDTATAALAVAAINALTTVNSFVAASKYFGSLALSTVVAGTTINVCGYIFTATASATGKPGEFSISGDDTADAVALAAAINATPVLCQKLVAVNSTSTCYVFLTENRARRSDETLSASATTVTCTQITTGVTYGVFALVPGTLGNCCTLTASATSGTSTVFTAGSGKLGGGTGGYVSGGQYLTSDMK